MINREMLDRYTDRAHRYTAGTHGVDVLHPIFHSTVYLAHVPVLISTLDSVLIAAQFFCHAIPCNCFTSLHYQGLFRIFLKFLPVLKNGACSQYSFSNSVFRKKTFMYLANYFL